MDPWIFLFFLSPEEEQLMQLHKLGIDVVVRDFAKRSLYLPRAKTQL
jgi:hypothetical protein